MNHKSDVTLPDIHDDRTADAPSGSICDRAVQAAPVLAKWAATVDAQARFPEEPVAALAQARLLSAAVPEHLGGEGASVLDLARATRILGRECLSTAMIFAMHQSQVLLLVRHGRTEYLDQLLRCLCDEQFLVASSTTEFAIGGDARSSSCAIIANGRTAKLHKVAPVISYGQYAQVVLATARRTLDSAAGDQVLVACQRDQTTLGVISEWNTLGMRATCSPGFHLSAEVPTAAVLSDDYGTISRETGLPVGHILWAAAWLGNADTALSKAMQVVQSATHNSPDVASLEATRLAELHLLWQQLVDIVAMAALRYQRSAEDESPKTSGISHALTYNALKINSATMASKITTGALKICGIRGYQNDNSISLGRQIRDSLSASIMINDDRLLANNAQLILALRNLPSDLASP
jgi:acyl-CoA dehydrogenase